MIKKFELEGTGLVYDRSEILKSVKNYENLFTCNDLNFVDLDLEDIIFHNSPKLEKQLAKG